MQVCLIVPGPLATVSGGHTYDRRMADGLREQGHDVQVVELEVVHCRNQAEDLA